MRVEKALACFAHLAERVKALQAPDGPRASLWRKSSKHMRKP